MPETNAENEKNRKNPDFKSVLSYFEEVSKIPRCSQNEERIASYIENFGKSRGFKTARDPYNNILIKIPASPGYENHPAVILQSHMDMVCEKEAGSPHNFSSDGIRLSYVTEDGIRYLTADGTTLGADNGIGLAYSLAIAASSDIEHPPLELLFTADEEEGLTGAQGLADDFLSADYMINLDSEEEGVLIVGCAGGTQIGFKKLIDVEEAYADDSEREDVTDGADRKDVCTRPSAYTVTVDGLLGGHSGTDIHLGRANANRILVTYLKIIREKYPHNCFKLIKIKGGSAHNTIPRRADCLFVTTVSLEILKEEADNYAAQIKSGPGYNDPDLALTVMTADLSKLPATNLKAFSTKNTQRLLLFLEAIPTGVFEMSSHIPDLVLVSGNMAVIRTRSSAEYTADRDKESSEIDIYTEKAKREVEIIYSLRSGSEAELKNKVKDMMTLADRFLFNFEISHTYAPWEPDFDAAFLQKCRDVYVETFGKDAKATAIHAGLECGVFRKKYPVLQMISIGPDILGAHTPSEKLSLEAADNVWLYLKALLKSFGSETEDGEEADSR